jgi:hypothetical protein
MSIITNKFKTSNAATFKQDFIDSDYYIFVSSTQITQTNDSEYYVNEFLENTLFGKKVNPDEVFFMLNDYRWQSGLIFDMYDDKVDLSEKKFYTIVYPTDNSTGDYRVYKCLSNNHGAKSLNPPNYDADTDDQIYRMGDGYVWKFMYTISTVEYQKYSALQYFPILYPTAVITNVVATGTAITYFADNTFKPGMLVTIEDIIPTQFNVTNRVITAATPTRFTISGAETGTYSTASQGVAVVKNGAIDKRSIDHIEVENYDLNKGYELRSGIIEGVGQTNITISSPKLDLNPLANYYSGQTFYVKNTNNYANTYTIDTYTYNQSTKEAVITLLDKDSFIQKNFDFEIFPKIEIAGDGTGAEAIPKINSLGTIETILILNKGSGYTRATARVIRPLYGFDTVSALSTDVEAILRPILSPKNGHGYNFETELLSRRAHVYTSLTDTDNISIPSSNVYTKIGIVKNPEFTANTDLFDNRLKLTLSSSILTVGETVTQNYQAPISFSAEVHAVDGNIAYLCNYHGPYRTYPDANSSAEGYEDIPINIKSSIISSQNQILNINNIIRPNYIQKTGDVYYVTNFVPITRTTTSNEEYKIVLEF